MEESQEEKKLVLEDLLKNGEITRVTYDKIIIAKNIIENKYNLKNTKATKLNSIIAKIDSLDIPQPQKESLKKRMLNIIRKSSHKQTILDYESLSIIGRGAFGEVHVCRNKTTKEIVAIKKIKKTHVLEKNQMVNSKNEQAFMSKVQSPLIVELKASFQEGDYLYLVMEYLPGGDLMSRLLLKDKFTEKDAQFYFAELILCIEVIHKLNCIHRDLKPDNILIDKYGHIKLSDFGLAKIADDISGITSSRYENSPKHKRNFSCVGTAYYVAPEVLEKKGYGKDIDWWSAGAILYEMLIGHAPFYSEYTAETCYKILNWNQFLKFPSKKPISPIAKDLILKLLCCQDVRLGKDGINEIKAHPFFKGIEWSCIGNRKPPFIPQLKSDYDNSYFANYEIDEPFHPIASANPKRKDIMFLGYTYNSNDDTKMSYIEILNEIVQIDKANSDKKVTQEKKLNLRADDDLGYIFGSKKPTGRGSVTIIPMPKKFQIDCSKKISTSDKSLNTSKNGFTSFDIKNTKMKFDYKTHTSKDYRSQWDNNNNTIDDAKEQLSLINKKIKKRTRISPFPNLGKDIDRNINNNYNITRKFIAVSAEKKILIR